MKKRRTQYGMHASNPPEQMLYDPQKINKKKTSEIG